MYCRGLFIIDPQGTVRQITVNDLPVGRSVDETLRLIHAFQFVEKHGEGTVHVDTFLHVHFDSNVKEQLFSIEIPGVFKCNKN